jgi:MFS family permease
MFLAIALLYTHARELVDESVAATGVSFVSSTALLGSFSAPLVAGTLLQWSGSYLPAFLSAGAAATVGLVLAWTVPERVCPSGPPPDRSRDHGKRRSRSPSITTPGRRRLPPKI